jgi:hypothetical protein
MSAVGDTAEGEVDGEAILVAKEATPVAKFDPGAHRRGKLNGHSKKIQLDGFRPDFPPALSGGALLAKG